MEEQQLTESPIEDPIKEVEPEHLSSALPSVAREENWGWGELLYGVLFQPVSTLRYITSQPLLGKALLVILMIQLGNWYMSVATAADEDLLQSLLAEYPALTSNLTSVLLNLKILSVMAGLTFSLLIWFVGSAIFNLLAELQGGSSNGRGLLAALGFAQLPEIALIPVRYFFLVVNWSQIGVTLISLGIGIWVIILSIISIREATGLTNGHAILTFFLPGLVVAGLASFFVLIGVMALVPLAAM